MLPSGTICKMCKVPSRVGQITIQEGIGKKGTSVLEGVFRVAGGIIIGVEGSAEYRGGLSHSKMITVTLLSLAGP